MALNVAPGTTVNNLSQFKQVLVVITNGDELVGIWAPMIWTKLGSNAKTLKVVNAKDLSQVIITNEGPELVNQILISRTPLDYDEAQALIDRLNDQANIFVKTIDAFQALIKLAVNDEIEYNLILIPMLGHLHEVTSNWLAKTEPERLTRYNDNYLPKVKPSQPIIDLLTIKLNQLVHQVVGPLPYDKSKLSLVLKLIHLLVDSPLSTKFATSLIAKLINSAELCPLIKQLDLFPIKPNANELLPAIEYLGKEEVRCVLASIKEKDVIESIKQFRVVDIHLDSINLKLKPPKLELGNASTINITDDSVFVFKYSEAKLIAEDNLYDLIDHRFLVDYFLGFPMAELDLTNSFLTGSIIPATLCRFMIRDKFIKGQRIINALYPKKYTQLEDPNDGVIIASDLTSSLSIEAIPEIEIVPDDEDDDDTEAKDRTKIVLTIDNNPAEFKCKITSGADIDIAIDVETGFDQIAEAHFKVIAKHYPKATMSRINNKGGYLYEITNLPRSVQIYRSDRRHILTHHVPMTRGYITGKDQRTYLSATCLHSYLTHKFSTYYFFMGKQSPIEILLKYEQRGFKINIPQIEYLIQEHSNFNQKWQRHVKLREIKQALTIDDNDHDPEILGALWLAPAFLGYGNFDIYDLADEYQHLLNFTPGYANAIDNQGNSLKSKRSKRLRNKLSESLKVNLSDIEDDDEPFDQEANTILAELKELNINNNADKRRAYELIEKLPHRVLRNMHKTKLGPILKQLADMLYEDD